MRKALLGLALMAPACWAAPWLACDLPVEATHYATQSCTSIDPTGLICQNWGAPWSADKAYYQGAVVRECHDDLSSVALGRHIVRAKSVSVDAVWGRQESAPSDPLAFSRPGLPAAPTGVRLTAQ